MRAGKIIPPMAAATGKIAFLTVLSSPTKISFLISIPITKKKIAIKPSLIQCCKLSPKIWVCKRLKYSGAHTEFAVNIASPAHRASTIPEEASIFRKVSIGHLTIFVNDLIMN
ncbi:hypothetical protein D3C86_1715110 [compost metagenome]